VSIKIFTEIKENLEFRQATLPRLKTDTTLLFFHGMSHNASFYDEWLRSLALNDGLRGVAVSLEGHGASPLTPAQSSVNSLSIASYKQNILTAIKECVKHSKSTVLVCHSMAGRCLDELLREQLLPEQVRGVVFIAPVPSQGALSGAFKCTANDLFSYRRLTPFTFPHALLITKDIGSFLKSDPARALSIFFSSDSDKGSRLYNIDANTFCRDYLGPESARAVWEVLWPSRVPIAEGTRPILIMGSYNDRLFSPISLERMTTKLQRNGHRAITLKKYNAISHDMPMDLGREIVLGDLRNWLKSISSGSV
jgi:pimeloyl-ACP methyl ester carboxylesterase